MTQQQSHSCAALEVCVNGACVESKSLFKYHFNLIRPSLIQWLGSYSKPMISFIKWLSECCRHHKTLVHSNCMVIWNINSMLQIGLLHSSQCSISLFPLESCGDDQGSRYAVSIKQNNSLLKLEIWKMHGPSLSICFFPNRLAPHGEILTVTSIHALMMTQNPFILASVLQDMIAHWWTQETMHVNLVCFPNRYTLSATLSDDVNIITCHIHEIFNCYCSQVCWFWRTRVWCEYLGKHFPQLVLVASSSFILFNWKGLETNRSITYPYQASMISLFTVTVQWNLFLKKRINQVARISVRN